MIETGEGELAAGEEEGAEVVEGLANGLKGMLGVVKGEGEGEEGTGDEGGVVAEGGGEIGEVAAVGVEEGRQVPCGGGG